MAPGTIRMSGDEKRVKIIEIFRETKDFFQLKEIEKLASKRGVVEKTVKDILLLAVADGQVDSDKIGSSNFFWSFPSAQGATLQKSHRSCHEEGTTHESKIQEFQQAMECELADRTDSMERGTSLQEYQRTQEELDMLRAEQAAYGKCDPEHLAQQARANFLAKEAALRWTDNVVISRDYFINLVAMVVDEVNQHFGITIDFEDLE